MSGLISPIIGGILYDAVGYHTTMDICSLTLILCAVAYVFCNSGLTLMRDHKQQIEDLKDLKRVHEEIGEIKKNKNKHFSEEK